MDSFNSYLLRKFYRETARDGDKLAEAEQQIIHPSENKSWCRNLTVC